MELLPGQYSSPRSPDLFFMTRPKQAAFVDKLTIQVKVQLESMVQVIRSSDFHSLGALPRAKRRRSNSHKRRVHFRRPNSRRSAEIQAPATDTTALESAMESLVSTTSMVSIALSCSEKFGKVVCQGCVGTVLAVTALKFLLCAKRRQSNSHKRRVHFSPRPNSRCSAETQLHATETTGPKNAVDSSMPATDVVISALASPETCKAGLSGLF
jgi:hypothetical protein